MSLQIFMYLLFTSIFSCNYVVILYLCIASHSENSKNRKKKVFNLIRRIEWFWWVERYIYDRRIDRFWQMFWRRENSIKRIDWIKNRSKRTQMKAKKRTLFESCYEHVWQIDRNKRFKLLFLSASLHIEISANRNLTLAHYLQF